MKRILINCLLGATFGLLVLNISVSGQTIQGFLRRSNTQIVNNQGAVELKGVNLGNWLHIEPYMIQAEASATRSQTILSQQITQLTGDTTFAKQFFTQWRDTFIQEKDIELLANLGFNHLRVPFPSHLFWNETTNLPTDEGFIYLDRIIQWGKKYDLYIILDLHEAPGGQIDGELWSNFEVNKTRTIDIWRRIATRYAQESTVGGYDILNEPLITNQADQWKLRNLYLAITQAIRLVDSNHLLFFEGNWYASSFWELTDGTPSENDRWDANMAFSHHVYWVPLPSQTTFWVDDIATKMSIPVWCGEGGENSNHWIADWIQDCQNNQMGWCFWTYKKAASISSVVTHALSANYRQITAFWKGEGTQPSTSVARQGFLDLIQGSDLNQCTQSKDVQDALLRTDFLTKAKPFKSHSIPGTIQAVDFDLGGNNVGYRDAAFQSTGQGANYTNYNQGWTYRNDGVDIETWTGSPTVGQITADEWLQYSIQVPNPGLYQIKLEYATTSSSSRVHFSMDGQTLQDTLTLPATSGWSSWRVENVVRVPLWTKTDDYKLKLYFQTGGLNVRSIQLERLGPLALVQSPTQVRNGNTVALQWRTEPTQILTNFRVEYREVGQTAWQISDRIVSTATSHQINNLDATKSYEYRIIPITTLGDAPAVMLDFQVESTKILDDLSIPSLAAYGLRKLRKDYIGAAIAVRRNTDQAVQDIGFTSAGELDITALLQFIGQGSGFVATWYDQSGNYRNLQQSQASLQPRIVNTGQIERTSNGQVGVRFLGSSGQESLGFLSNQSFVTNEFSVNLVFTEQVRTNQIAWQLNRTSDIGNRTQVHLPWSDGNIYFDVGGFNGSFRISSSMGRPVGTTNQFSFSNSVSANQKYIAVNGEIKAQGVGTAAQGRRIQIGAIENYALNGFFSEWVLFGSALDSENRSKLETNQANFFNLFPTIPTAVSNLQAEPGYESVKLTWTAPTPNPIDYAISFRRTDDTTWYPVVKVASNVANFWVKGLPGGIPFEFRVIPRNSAGSGPMQSVLGTPLASAGVVNRLVQAKPAGLYSLRKVRDEYQGPAIRVRRDSDNQLALITFLANGELDEVSLLQFVGNGNGFVETWFDQSSKAYHAVQLNASNQPRIVISGALVRMGDKPSLSFSGQNTTFLQFQTQLSLLTYSASIVVQSPLGNVQSGGLFLGNETFLNYDFLGSSASGHLEVSRNTLQNNQKVSSVSNLGKGVVLSSHFESSGKGSGHVDMLRVGTFTFAPQNLIAQLGRIGNYSTPWEGLIAECFLFENNLDYMEANMGESSQYDYFSLGKETYIPKYLEDNTTVQGKQFTRTNTFQSPNFWISWGYGVGPDPKNARGEWATFDPMETMIMSERVYKGFKDKTGFLVDSVGTNLGKYQVPIVLCGSYGFNQGMCSAFAAGNGVNWDGVIGGFLVYPSGVLDENLFAHEFVHSLQAQAANDKLLKCPTVGFSAFHILESQANYLRSVLYPEICSPYGVDFYHTLAPEPHWNSAYQGEVIFYALEADGGVQRASEVWLNNCEGQTVFDTYRVQSQKTQDQLNDFIWRNYAAASVGLDFQRNGTFLRNARNVYQNSDIRVRMRMWDIVSPIDTLIQRYKIPNELAPEDYAFNMIRVIPRNRAETVQLEFKGRPEINTHAGWRYGWVTRDAAGVSQRYIGPFKDTVKVISIDLQPNEIDLFLVVLGAPVDKSYINSVRTTLRGKNSKFNYPYELLFENAWPEGYQPPSQFRTFLRTGGQIHPNGGGYIRNSQVDPTVYIGPNCYVVNSTVRGNVRIEGTAYVQNATLSGQVIVKNNAYVSGGTYTENALISGNAQVNNCVVSGTAEIGDLVEISNYTLGGTIKVMGDVFTGAQSSCNSGHYASLTNYFSNNPLPCDNRQDTLKANVQKPNYRFYGESIRLRIEKQQMKAIFNLESLAKFNLDGGPVLTNTTAPVNREPHIVYQESAWKVWNGSEWRVIPDYPASIFSPLISLPSSDSGKIVFLNDRLWGWNGTSWRRLVSPLDSDVATSAEIKTLATPIISVQDEFMNNQSNLLQLSQQGVFETAHGTVTTYYQWQQDEIDLPNQTSPSLQLTPDQAQCGASYRLKVTVSTTFDQKVVFTNPIQFACEPPVWNIAPNIQAKLETTTYGNLEVTSGVLNSSQGTIILQYQWQRNGVPIQGETKKEYKPISSDWNQTITCQVIAFNSVGSVTLTLTAPPLLFQPLYLAATSLWLDATAQNSIQKSANTQQVAQWNDLSGAGRNVLQGNIVSQPNWSSQGPDGLPALFFDGINDRLEITNPLLNTNPLAIFSVTHFLGTGSFSLISNDKPYFYGKGIGISSNNRAGLMMNDAILEGTNQSWLPNQNTLVSAIYSSQNTELFIQGNRVISAGFRENINSLDGENMILIGSGQIAGNYNPAKYISEIVILSQDIIPSSPDLQHKMEGYLAWKWKLQIQLPANHPYKNTPP
ncbi:MAG: DUF6055 domain-containing protein [Spirosomataceae bacterium]